MKLSKSGIFLIIILVIAIGLGAWVTVMTCDVSWRRTPSQCLTAAVQPVRRGRCKTPTSQRSRTRLSSPWSATARLPRSRPGAILTAILIKTGLPGRFPAWWSIWSQDEFTLANLECTFSDEKLKSSSLFYFRGPSSYADILVQGSVECATLGNNHTDDFGAKGVTDTEGRARGRRCSVGGRRRIQGDHDRAWTEDRHLLSGVDRPEQKQHHRRYRETQGRRRGHSDLRPALGHGGQLQGDCKSGILCPRGH